LRDKSFMGMDEKMWDQVISVHLRGTYRVCLFPLQSIGRRTKRSAGECGLAARSIVPGRQRPGEAGPSEGQGSGWKGSLPKARPADERRQS
jgi:NAD(P)-dependent dehydrogenase (short-subunit alcohol dehydrogenase family)